MTAHKIAPEVKVYVNGRHEDSVRCLDVFLGSGANDLPRAILEVQRAGRDDNRRTFYDGSLAVFNQSQVEVVINNEVVHWGKSLAQNVTLDGTNGDRVTIISRMEPQHFGGPNNATIHFSPLTGGPVPISLPTVFNPEWNGESIGNMHSFQARGTGANVFYDVEASRTVQARQFNGSIALRWDLARAAYYLCCWLNPSQTYVSNPSFAELREVLGTSISLLRNHEAPFGEYLPEQLDRLLNPFGFAWTVDFTARGRRKIRVFERGKGPRRDLKLQAPGSKVDVAESNLEALSLSGDVSNKAFNIVHIYGAPKVYEATFLLVPGWPERYDNYPHTNPEALIKDNAQWGTNPILRDVHRKWVLNEAGDYNGYRRAIRAPFDLSPIIGTRYIPRRRKFLPCLTQNDDGSPQGDHGGVFVEYLEQVNLASEQASGTWIPVTKLDGASSSYVVLDGECGIRFTGEDIPYEIFAQGTYARVRVTASIEADERLFVERRPTLSLLREPKYEVFDLPSRFKFRTRHQSSRFVGTPFRVAFQNDTSIAAEFGDKLLASWNQASINGSVTLTGIDYDYSNVIGATISGVAGRRVDFKVSPGGVAKYPSVTSARINIQNQSLDLTLDTQIGAIAA